MWTEEDTEVLQIANRVRQVLCKRDPDLYSNFMESPYQSPPLKQRVGDYELCAYKSGEMLIRDMAPEAGYPREVFRLMPLQAKSRPNCRWNKDLIREKVVPAMDAEMVLDDLSLL